MKDCAVHRTHQDSPESSESHHVPLGWNGPNVLSNRVSICPSAHSDVHLLLNLLVLGEGVIPDYVKWRRWNPAMRALAQRGYDEAVVRGLVPRVL
jgi:hypothetical protein